MLRHADAEGYVEILDQWLLDKDYVPDDVIEEYAKGDGVVAATAATALANRDAERWQSDGRTKPAEDRRSVRVALQVTPAEREELGRRAADAGVGVSEYLRRAALGHASREGQGCG